MMNQQRFDVYCLRVALESAGLSNDPSTKVGAVIARRGEIISTGWNRFPTGIEELPDRMADRDTKLSLILHAEQLAIIAAGHRAEGSTMYVAAMDATGDVWGGPPCTRCLVECIEAGIRELVSFPIKTAPSRWHGDLLKSCAFAQEAGLHYRQISTLFVSDHNARMAIRAEMIARAEREQEQEQQPAGRSLGNHPDGCCG